MTVFKTDFKTAMEDVTRMREEDEKQKRIRECLKCELKFTSKHKFNRMCDTCKQTGDRRRK